MFGRLLEIVLGNSIYSISGLALLLLALISLKSEEFYKGIKIILWFATLVWVLSVGYEYNSGYNVLYLLDKSTEGSLDPGKDRGAFEKYYSTESTDKIKRGN